MTVYGYLRVSNEQQIDGVSLEDQFRCIEGRALEQDWQLARFFVERGVSGSVPLSERPEGARLLNALASGDVVIATRLDRMFRSAVDALNIIGEFQYQKISLELLDLGGDVSGGGIASLMLTILAAVAESERDHIRERDRIRDSIRDAKRHHRRHGRYLGGDRPFGWDIDSDRNLVPNPNEQREIREISRLRADGMAWRAIARLYNKAPIQIKRIVAAGAAQSTLPQGASLPRTFIAPKTAVGIGLEGELP